MKLHALILGAALTAACGGVDTGVENEGSWSLDLSTPDGALLGVWGTSPDDVWVVGGQVDRSIVLHKDGDRWNKFDVHGASSLLYTVYGFSASDVYAVGEHGLILHFDGVSWQRIASGTDRTLYGVWGTSGDDVWIVGGDRFGVAGAAVVLHGSKGVFEAVELPRELAPSVLYKAHGFATDDVFIVGAEGVLHWNGTTWRKDAVPTAGPLFSTWGRGSNDLYAVGGIGAGDVLHFDGTAWRQVVQLPIDRGLSGVFTSMDGPTYAVGSHALIVELGQDGSLVHAAVPDLEPLPFLHAVWGDDQGTVYAVGGDVSQYPGPMTGTILRRD